MRLLEGDQAAGQLQQREVVLGLLRPADEQGAVAVQPGVGGLHDPAPGAPAGDVELERDLLAAAADVRSKSVAGEQLATLAVVVGCIVAEALRRRCRGQRPRDGYRTQRRR